MGKCARRSISNYTHSLGFAIHDFANPSYFPVHFVFECSRGAKYLPVFRLKICLLRTPHFGNQVEEFFCIHIDLFYHGDYIYFFSAADCRLYILSWIIRSIYFRGSFRRIEMRNSLQSLIQYLLQMSIIETHFI